MTTVKFAKRDEVLAAMIRALADKVAGHKIVANQTDDALRENGYYEFKFWGGQKAQFESYVKNYLRDDHQASLEITDDSLPYNGF